ncbi:MAG: flippase [Lachnospiraceae bacterium]|nr:flippase [Lachnospiraceae bacterium]
MSDRDNNNRILARNAVLNTIRQACAILFPLVTFPYITRVLGASNYGKINFSVSVITYVSLVAQLGIKNYAIREGARLRDDKDKLENFINEVFTISLLSTILAYSGLGVLLFSWNKLQDYRLIICILSLSIVFNTLGMEWINSIFEDYLYITIRYVICHLIALVAILLLVNKQEDYIIYAFLSIIAGVLANGFNIFYVRKKYSIHLRIKKKFKAHLKAICLLFGMSIAIKIYVQADVLIIGVYESDAEVGYYTVAANMYMLIKQLINAVLIVAVPRISNMISKYEDKYVRKQLGTIHNILLLIAFPAVAGLFMLKNDVVMLFSGEEYLSASEPLGILAFSLFFATLGTFYSNVVMIPNRMEKHIFFITWINAILNIVLNIIFVPVMGIKAAAITTLVAELLVCVSYFFFSHKMVLYSFKPYLCGGLIAGLVVGVCYIIKRAVFNTLLTVIISGCLSLLLFAMVCIVFFKRNYSGKQ